MDRAIRKNTREDVIARWILGDATHGKPLGGHLRGLYLDTIEFLFVDEREVAGTTRTQGTENPVSVTHQVCGYKEFVHSPQSTRIDRGLGLTLVVLELDLMRTRLPAGRRAVLFLRVGPVSVVHDGLPTDQTFPEILDVKHIRLLHTCPAEGLPLLGFCWRELGLCELPLFTPRAKTLFLVLLKKVLHVFSSRFKSCVSLIIYSFGVYVKTP
jgi:hypothetical protein